MPNTTTINDLIDPLELVGFVRTLPFFGITGPGSFEDFFPVVEDEDLEYSYNKGQLIDQKAAQYRAFDTPAPVTNRQGYARVRGELPPISNSIPLGEEERLRYAAVQSGNYDRIIDAIYNDAANLTRSIQMRIEMARGELLSAGTVTLNENGVQATYDSGIPSANKVTPASTLWSDPSADIIGDLTTWKAAYRVLTRGFVVFGEMVISAQLEAYMLRNTAIRQLAGNLNGTPTIVTPDTVQSILAAHGLPRYRVDDRMVINSSGSSVRLVAANKVIFIPAGVPLGQTSFGVPAEAISGVQRGLLSLKEAPGIWAQTWEENNPVKTNTLATGIVLPIMPNSAFIFIATVY